MQVQIDRLAVEGRTPFAVWRDGDPIGVVAVADRVKPEARDTVARLRRAGLQVAMVTGDHRATARAVAADVGIRRVSAEVGPEGKVEEVAQLQRAGHRVIFVGDGLNDAPALAKADVGVAMGGGTDVALAAAEVNLLGGSLASVADAIELARRTYRVIAQNLFWAFAYNVVMIPLAVVRGARSDVGGRGDGGLERDRGAERAPPPPVRSWSRSRRPRRVTPLARRSRERVRG